MKHSQRSNSTKTHNLTQNVCQGINLKGQYCRNCLRSFQNEFDLSQVDLISFAYGYIIRGGITPLGWVGVKSVTIGATIGNAIKDYVIL